MAGGQTDGQASPARPSKLRALLVPGALLAAGLLLGALLGYSIAASQVEEYRTDAAAAREDLDVLARAHETLQERNWILYLDLEQTREQSATPRPELPEGTYGDGTYEVGIDIQPGTYAGTVTGEFGYWARLKGTSDMVSGIEANGIVRGPFVLTIVSSDVAVELRGVTLTRRD